MSVFLFSSISNRLVCGFTGTSTTRMISRNKSLATSAFGTYLSNGVVSRSTAGGKMTKLFMSSTSELLTDEQVKEIEAQIKTKGDEIRQLKADGIDKESLAPHVAELIALKSKIAPPEEPKKKKAPKKKNPQKQKKPQPKKESEMSDSELRAARLQKAENMKEAGVEPYEYTYDPTHTAMELQSLYEGKLEGGEEDEESDVAVAGRIMAKRVFGKLAFFTLQDESGTVQLHLEKNRLGDTFKVCMNEWIFTHVQCFHTFHHLFSFKNDLFFTKP